MDKVRLLHSINGLRRGLRAGKSLRPACTVLGQQIGSEKKVLFCTSDAVDMQRLFHSWFLVTTVEQAMFVRCDHVRVHSRVFFCTTLARLQSSGGPASTKVALPHIVLVTSLYTK